MGFQKMKRATLILITIIALSACSTTKEMRRANRASKKLEKLVDQFPDLAQPDTLRDTVAAIVPIVRIDTAFAKADTVFLQKERLRVRVITEHDTIRILGECLGDTIFVPIETIVEKIQPVQYKALPMKWWQRKLQSLGILFLGIIIIFIVIRIIQKTI
jgi:hypothetical protein